MSDCGFYYLLPSFFHCQRASALFVFVVAIISQATTKNVFKKSIKDKILNEATLFA